MIIIDKISRKVVCSAVSCLLFFSTNVMAQQVQEETVSPMDSSVVNLDEVVDMGFSTSKKRDIVGAVSFVKPAEIVKYDHSQSVAEGLYHKVTGLEGTSSIRGFGSALIVVDGVPGRYIGLLNMSEVESITVLKDANAIVLYGAMAKNGVILVTTKRGKANSTGVNVNANFGVKQPMMLPKYLNSADYMTEYNKAFKNDGLGEFKYDPETEIPNYRDQLNPLKYPDVDFFSDEYVKPFTTYEDILAEFYGGNKETQYYINLGFNNDESMLKFDQEKGNYRFNVRANVDFKVNKWISSSIDAVAIFAEENKMHGDFWGASNTFRPFLYSPLLPLSAFDFETNPDMKGMVDAANKYEGGILGGSRTYEGITPFGDFYAKGYIRKSDRVSQINSSIKFDLSSITEGLSARTYVSFDYFDSFNASITNNYSVYSPTWGGTDGNQIVALEKLKGPDSKQQDEQVKNNDFMLRYGFYGSLDYVKNIGDNHSIQSTVVAYANNTFDDGQKQSRKNAHLGFTLRYGFKNRLMADFSGAYINSIKMAEGHRGSFSPTFGLGYVVSDHINASWLDHLKVRASIGFINHDIDIQNEGGGYYLYKPVFRTSDWNNFAWGDVNNTNSPTTYQRGENLDLEPEQRQDINIGFEASLMKQLWVEANFFQTDLANQLALVSVPYPSYYGQFQPYGNNNEDRYTGFEMGVNYNKDMGDFSYKIGARLLYITSERLIVDEVWTNSFQYRQGKATDAMFGHTSLGFYGVDDFGTDGKLKEGMPVPEYGAVKPGDLMYLDKDGDGKINDNDQHEIGGWRSPWSLGSDIVLQYKQFTLYTLLGGSFGGDAQKGGSYYNPSGDNKYSEVVYGAWTPETAATATLPRLSTQSSSNNNKSSSFWMYDRSFVSIDRVQLSYDIPQSLVKNMSVFVAGTNLAYFGKNRDILFTRPGSAPVNRAYTTGIRVIF